RRAGPWVHCLDHMLGREDLHRMIKRQGSADSVGSGLAFRPRRALLEAHLARPFTRIAITAHPQEGRVGIRDRNYVTRIVVEPRKLRAHYAARRSQRRTRPCLVDLARRQLYRCSTLVRRNSSAEAPPPALSDQVT